MKKYLVIGDWITSKMDGQRHYVPSIKLIELFKLNRDECILADRNNPKSLVGLNLEDYVVIEPDYKGFYDSVMTRLLGL